MKIYIVSRVEGQYEIDRIVNMKAFKNKANADHYKHKCEFTWKKLVDFYYYPWKDLIMSKHGKELRLAMEKISPKYQDFKPATFYIDEIELL